MQKDVIYIDVEDDITAIIGKVKAAEHKIVALVPPKRIGAIQSAVNLKLVHRAAEQANKRLVIISNNHALVALAGSAGIPVAKNLQSKPELAEIPALDIDDGEDVIDGAELPVGEHAKMANGAVDDAAAPAVGAAAVDAAIKDAEAEDAAEDAAPVAAAAVPKRVTPRNKVAVPNFDRVRKKLFLIVGGGIALLLFLIWAIFIAPAARVVVTARTTDVALNSKATLAGTATTDLKAGTIKTEVKSTKKHVSIPFTATGKKDVGEKATGQVTFSNDEFYAVTVSGTVSAGGFNFVLSSPVTVPKGGCRTARDCWSGIATGTIVAAESGSKYNGVSGAVSGLPSAVSGTLANTSGGTDKVVTVVSQEDVDKVLGDATKAGEADAAKADIKKQFGDGYIVIDSSFKADTGAVKPAPAVGAEAPDNKATLAGDVTYSMTAVPKTEASKYLDAYFAQQIDGKNNQKVYSNGLKDLSFTNIAAADNGAWLATISTNGKIGPKINEQDIKNYAKGKRYGDIQTYIKQIDGVSDVDVKFSPFWVNTAPGDANKIKVEFKVNGA